MTNNTAPHTPWVPPPSHLVDPVAPFVPTPWQFTPGANFDVGGQAVIGSRRRGKPNILRIFKTNDPNVVRWEMYFNSFDGGLDLQVEDILGQVFSGKLASTDGVDASWADSLILASLTVTDATPDLGSPSVVAWADVAGRFILGGGSTADSALFDATTITNSGINDPTPSAYNYDPGAVIHALTEIVIASATPRLAVSKQGAAVEILSALGSDPPTSDGSMHASWTTNYGFITTPLNSVTPGAGTILGYGNGGIQSLSTTAAIGDAPTSVLTTLKNGGHALAALEFPGIRPSAYWFIPRTGSTAMTTTEPGDIIGTDYEGENPQRLYFPMQSVFQDCVWNDQIVASDHHKVYAFNGRARDLGWRTEREGESNLNIRLEQLSADRGRLFAQILLRDSTTGTPTHFWTEEYVEELGAWFQITARTACVTALTKSPGGFPIGHTAGGNRGTYLYGKNTTDWFTTSIPPVNPFFNSKATGTPFNDHIWEGCTSGTAKTPIYHFLPGAPKVVAGIWFGGDLQGTDASVKIEPAVQTGSAMTFSGNAEATFNQRDRWERHQRLFPRGSGAFDRAQFQWTLTQGTSGSGVTRTTPNALPAVVWGYAFLDRKVKTPVSIDGEGWRFA